MIILKKLKWSNCFSYGPDNEIDLCSNPLTQILGENGSGKSSIPLILEEVLFNKNSKGVKKISIPNRNLDGSYSISLSFEVDNTQYLIELHRSKTLKIKLFKDGEDISSHTATNTFKTIEGILGLDFKTFSQLVYQSPVGSLEFLTATDAVRKKFLIELLNLSKYVDYFELFKSLLKDYNLKLSVLDSKVDTITSWLNKNDLGGMKVLPIIKFGKNTEKEEETLGILLTEFKNISNINKKITKNNHYKEQLAKVDLSAATSIKAIEIQSYDDLTGLIGTWTGLGRAAINKVNKANELGNECPTCKQSIDTEFKDNYIQELLDKSTEYEKKVSVAEKEITDIKKNNADFNKKQRIEREFQSLFNSVDNDLDVKLVNPDDISIKVIELKKVIKGIKEEESDTNTENLKRERNNTKISIIKEQKDEFKAQLAEVSTELIIVQNLYNNLDILRKAFSTNGLIAYKIENLVKELEELVNDYLAKLSDGKFTLEFAVLKDKLNVNITDNGVAVDIEALSSGELAKVNTSTLLAIRKLMNSISKSRINVLFLDEVISVLDTLGRELLVEVLLEEKALNVYLVSHEWENPLLSKIVVSKDKEISRVLND